MIALACDHGGFVLMQEVKRFLDDGGYAYKDFGTHTEERCDYPVVAEPASLAIINGECDRGIFICGTGIGMSMAANKMPGIRAAVCSDCYTAEMTRRHNDANVLTLGARVVGDGLALMIVDLFLRTGFEGGRHAYRVELVNKLGARQVDTNVAGFEG